MSEQRIREIDQEVKKLTEERESLAIPATLIRGVACSNCGTAYGTNVWGGTKYCYKCGALFIPPTDEGKADDATDQE
jgi:uncharacterized OB-fold protein